ncbi:MAG: TIM barrel protein [Candidatus Latescibacteria bacterium]|nr:TIM barrel protein [Candidatus Latescibacterota bacterium]
MSAALDYGVQSFCFRNFKDNADVAQKVKEIGLDKIEVCAVHADFNDPASWKDTVKTYNDAGVAVVSIGVQTFTGAQSDRDFFECAALAGARHISCHFQIDTYTKAIGQVRAWCREFDIKVGIHCHGGYSFGGQPDVLRHLIALGAPEVGLCIDTAWAMQIGPRLGDPVRWAKDFAKHVHGVHYKDFTFGTDGMWTDTVVGEGNLDLKGFIDALEAGGFDGMAVIEYEADPENPVPALKACVEAMRATVG